LKKSLEEEANVGVSPPNITAWSSSVTVKEKAEQGGGLDPLLGGDDHKPI